MKFSLILKVFMGIVFLALGLAAVVSWRLDLISLIKGAIGPFLILAALVIFVIAKE